MTLRTALVYNFEDDNFSWMDASVDQTTSLEDVVCMGYFPDPGWQTRWQDLIDDGTTWQDLIDAGTRWIDLYSGDQEQNLYWLTEVGVYLSDQVVKKDGMKEYFLDRPLIDLNDMVESFTQDRWIYANEMYFEMWSPYSGILENPFTVALGWANTLMDAPAYPAATTINLQTRQNNGTVKHDFRATGRYLSIRMTFNGTDEIRFPAATLMAKQTYGR